MTSMSNLVDAVLSEVYGYTATVDTTTYLAAGIDADDLSISVGSATGFSRGIIQIDDELMIAESVDRANNLITLSGTTSRGIRGTTAASHSAGAIVTMSPSIPRHQVKDAINQTIRSSNGLFGVGSTTFTYSAAVSGYSITPTAETILSVTWLPSGPSNEYQRVRRWTHDKFNEQLVLGDAIEPGKTIRVTYTVAPAVPAESGDFSDTGLPDSCEDVIRFGAAWRVVSSLEPMNLMARSAEADAMNKQNTPGSRIRVGQYLYGMYQSRLREEVANLQSLYPTRVHWGG